MKRIYHIYILFFLVTIYACQEEIGSISDLGAPTNLEVSAVVSPDGSGIVDFAATSTGAIIYHYYFGIGDNENPTVSSNGNIRQIYRSSGNYNVRVIAFGPGGISTSASTNIDVEVTYEPPADLIEALTGGDTRNWIWDKEVIGHLGVGPLTDDNGNPLGEPIWYMAQPFEKESEGCLYSDVLTFSLDGNNVLYTLNNFDVTYFNRGEVNAALGLGAPNADQCYDFPVDGGQVVGFFESASGLINTTDISFNIGGNGFMSYFLGTSSYEILSYSDNEIYVRCIQQDDAGAEFAWYQRFIPEDGGGGGNEIEYELIWEEDFLQNGPPSSTNWSYDVGRGNNGWGNNEEQFYTDRPDNVFVENGILKIIAKRENYNGAQFTSARIKTEGKFEFTYGKIEFRAKLPFGGGTWPALWLLGADYQTNTWPAAGEMDVMEHVGNNQDVVQAAVHSPSSFSNTVNKGEVTVNGVSEDFHVYTLEWTAENLKFSVDGNNYYTYDPEVKNDETYPFNKDFFIIMNVAIGGDLGGTIDNQFTEGTMEVDYVRVYQAK